MKEPIATTAEVEMSISTRSGLGTGAVPVGTDSEDMAEQISTDEQEMRTTFGESWICESGTIEARVGRP